MCDYSLMGMPSRLAHEGEDLVTYRFRTGALGLIAAETSAQHPPARALDRVWSKLKALFRTTEDSNALVVCVPPGARLLVADISPEMQRALQAGPVEEVVFTQWTAAAETFRDAFRFKNGQEVLLQRLDEGQRVAVLQLALEEAPSRAGVVNVAE